MQLHYIGNAAVGAPAGGPQPRKDPPGRPTHGGWGYTASRYSLRAELVGVERL